MPGSDGRERRCGEAFWDFLWLCAVLWNCRKECERTENRLAFVSYEIVIDAGKIVGTKGESLVKIVISSDGGMLSAYPIK